MMMSERIGQDSHCLGGNTEGPKMKKYPIAHSFGMNQKMNYRMSLGQEAEQARIEQSGGREKGNLYQLQKRNWNNKDQD